MAYPPSDDHLEVNPIDLHAETAPFRHHEFLMQYWEKLRGNRAYPMLSEISQEALKDVWSYCFILSTEGDSYRYTYLGSDLAAISATDDNRLHVARVFANDSKLMLKKFAEVVQKKRALVEKSEFNNSEKKSIRYRMCLLPLGDANGEVGFIMGCVRWKVFEADGNPSSQEFTWDNWTVR